MVASEVNEECGMGVFSSTFVLLPKERRRVPSGLQAAVIHRGPGWTLDGATWAAVAWALVKELVDTKRNKKHLGRYLHTPAPGSQ